MDLLKTKVNHAKKRTFSPKTNDVKNNRSISKKSKNDISPSSLNETVVETSVPRSLEPTTSTLNLTSQSRSCRRVGRKMKVDISDPVFKVPFDNGWKRELVFRTTGAANETNRNADIYYYSPNNRKLRSFREIKKHLVQYNNDGNFLSKDNFTFSKQLIGINDRSKEITRTAKTKLSKEDPFFIFAKYKKPKTPVQPQSVNKPTESDQDKSNLEAVNTSLSTSEFVAEDSHLIQSNELSKASSPLKTNNVETNTSIVQRRLSTSDGEIIMQAPCGIQCAYSNEPGVLMCTQRLVNHHPACVGISANPNIDCYYCQNSSCMPEPSNNVMVDTLEPSSMTCVVQERKYLEKNSETNGLLKDKMHGPMTSTQSNTHMVKANTLKDILIYLNVNDLLKVSQVCSAWRKVTVDRNSLPSFKKLVHLKILSLTSTKAYNKDVNHSLQTITTELKYFEIGDCDCLSKDFAEVLSRFENLNSLRVENCSGKFDLFEQDIFCAIKNLKKLRKLELININFTSTVKDELEKCYGINALLIIPAYDCQAAISKNYVLDCLKKIYKTFTYVAWGLTNELHHVTDLFISGYQKNQHNTGEKLDLADREERFIHIPVLIKGKSKPEVDASLMCLKEKVDNVYQILILRK